MRVCGQAGTHRGCWSALPQSTNKREWVRLGLKKPVYALSVHIYETLQPGSVCRVRLASEPNPAPRDWTTAWSREGAPPASAELPACRIFSPPLAVEARLMYTCAVEVEVDTDGWGDTAWSEIDCLRVVGVPAAADVTVQHASRLLDRQPFETQREFETRARFAAKLLPSVAPTAAAAAAAAATAAAPPTTGGARTPEEMRLAALSMVWQNQRTLGCRYPADVEEQIGIEPPQAASGMAVEGERRAQQVAHTV